jgi:hypothetical protein
MPTRNRERYTFYQQRTINRQNQNPYYRDWIQSTIFCKNRIFLSWSIGFLKNHNNWAEDDYELSNIADKRYHLLFYQDLLVLILSLATTMESVWSIFRIYCCGCSCFLIGIRHTRYYTGQSIYQRGGQIFLKCGQLQSIFILETIFLLYHSSFLHWPKDVRVKLSKILLICLQIISAWIEYKYRLLMPGVIFDEKAFTKPFIR